MRPRNNGKFNHNYFRRIQSEHQAYWLGFIMADGHIVDRAKRGALQLQIHLNNKDLYHLKLFQSEIQSNKPIECCKDGSVRSSHSSDFLCNDLIKYGCTPRKSLTLKFPKLPKKWERHFVRGYFDGDGSACINSNRLFLQFMGTPEFLTSLKQRLRCENKKIAKRSQAYNLQIAGQLGCCYAINYMYRDATIYLKRKKDVIDRWIESHKIDLQQRGIKSYEYTSKTGPKNKVLRRRQQRK